MNKRLVTALAGYAILIAVGVWRLHGKMLYALLIVFGGLIVKTLVAHKAGWTFHPETQRSEWDSEVNHPEALPTNYAPASTLGASGDSAQKVGSRPNS